MISDVLCIVYWTGLDWTGLDWTGLDWTGLDWTGLDWIGVRKSKGELRKKTVKCDVRERAKVTKAMRCFRKKFHVIHSLDLDLLLA